MRKRKNQFFRAVCAVLCASIFLSVPLQKAAAVTSDSIKEKEAQIDQAEKEKEALKNSLSDIQGIKKELEAQRTNLKNYVMELDKNLTIIEERITDLLQRITVKEAEITEAEAQLEAAIEREESQKISMMIHVRMTYERGDPQLMDMLAGASSFGDFLNKADFVEKVMAYDKQIWQDYIRTREYVELCKRQLELEKEILDETKAGVELEQQNLEELIAQKTQDIVKYETDISTKEQAIQEYEEEIQAQEEMIAALEAAIEEEKQRILASSGVVLTYDGGVFKFPMATYTRITSPYGDRIHPTLGINQFHNGVDFAAPTGTAIYAAYDGIVVAPDYSSTMGNYVMIDHGGGLYTIYMHASALYVSKDDVVARGTTIAAVGSTGRTTGPHLHFSVRLNGSYVSPWNYLSQ